MLRITFLLRKRGDMSHDDFYDYWRRRHGPLVASFGDVLNARRYVQVHTLRDDPGGAAAREARGGMEPPYDGVAEMWWDSEESFAGEATSAARDAGAALVEDEAKFIDLANSPLWMCHEYPQVNPTPENIVARPRNSIVKLYFPLRHKVELSEAEAQAYWRTDHGPLIRSQAAGSGILRYIQVHRTAHDAEAALRAARGTQAESYTGHAELWFDRRSRGEPTGEARAAGRRAIEDESKFIDFDRSTIFHGKEHVFIDHTQGD